MADLTLSVWIYDQDLVLRAFRTMIYERAFRMFRNPVVPIVQANRLPLAFWFQPVAPDPYEVQRSYPKYRLIMYKLNMLHFMSLNEILVFQDEFIEFQNYYRKCMNIRGPVFDKDLDKIYGRKRDLLKMCNAKARAFYAYPLNLRSDMMVNDYFLFDMNRDNFIMDWDIFIYLVNLCLAKQPTDAEFMVWLDEHLCTDWNKMDESGEAYGGYWQYPEYSYERMNAYELSREFNILALIGLPYPRLLIKWSIDVGCSNGHESVRYSNHMCHIVEFFIKYLDMFNLREMCIYDLNSRGVSWPGDMIYVPTKTIYAGDDKDAAPVITWI